MADHEHPPEASEHWDNPDFCPFCGQHLPDGGAGFYDHIQDSDNATCRERFEEWRENVAGDIGGEWSG